MKAAAPLVTYVGTYTTKHGTTSTMNTANIGRARDGADPLAMPPFLDRRDGLGEAMRHVSGHWLDTRRAWAEFSSLTRR